MFGYWSCFNSKTRPNWYKTFYTASYDILRYNIYKNQPNPRWSLPKFINSVLFLLTIALKCTVGTILLIFKEII